MSLYGSAIYGISLYGDSKSVAYNVGFIANTIDYRTVDLSWKDTEIPSTDIIYAWKIIKTSGGVPDYPNQGEVVTYFVDQSPSAGKKLINGAYTDIDTKFSSSSIITYSFWGLIGINSTTATWKLLGSADAVIVDSETEDTTLKLLRLLPGAWTNSSADSLGEPDYPSVPLYSIEDWDANTAYVPGDNVKYKKIPYTCVKEGLSAGTIPSEVSGWKRLTTDLYNFVGTFGFYYDKLRAQASALNNMSDYRKYPKELLSSSITTLGFTYEPKLGDSFHRTLHKSGHLINSLKGTYLGLNNYIKALTHFKSLISIGRNMMLDYLQSSFEGSVSTWISYNNSTFAPTSRSSAALSNPSLGLTSKYLSDGYGTLTKTATSGTPYALSYGTTSVSDVTTKTMVVTPGTPYLFSGWARLKSGSTSTITVTAEIHWFDAVGTWLNSTPVVGTAVNPNSSGWSKFESSNTYSAIFAPTKAMYAGIKINTANMANTDAIYFDNFMFSVYPGFIGNKEFGSGDFIYEDARNILVNLEGYRTNLISNPGFEDNTGFWNTINGQFLSIQRPSSITALMVGSTSLGKFTATSNGNSAIYTNWIRNLKPGKQYTFSIYVIGPANGISVKAAIEYDMPQTIEDQVKLTQVTSPSVSAGKYLTTVNNKTYSSETVVNSSTWTRVSVTATAPEFLQVNGFPSAMVSVEFTANAASEVWYFDCALFEQSAEVNTYFQGNGGIVPPSTVPYGGTIPSIITDDLIPVGDTAWETRPRTNLLYNPGFEVSSSGSTNSWAPSASVSTFTVGNSSPTQAVGNYRAYITSATATNINISSVFRYPNKTTNNSIAAFPVGGEFITASAYVAHNTGDAVNVTISFIDGATQKTTSNVFTLPATSSSVSQWYRVHVTTLADKPTTLYSSGTIKIEFTPSGSNPVLGYICGAQVELGDYPTTYINSQNDATAVSNSLSSLVSTVTAVTKPLLYSNSFESGTQQSTSYLGTPTNITTSGGGAYIPSGAGFGIFNGSDSIAPSSAGAGASILYLRNVNNAFSVTPNYSYSAWAHVTYKSGTNATDVKANIIWYDSSKTVITTSSGSANTPLGTLNGTASASSTTVSMTNTSGVSVGMGVGKSGYIPQGTYVTSVTTNTSITLSQAVTTGFTNSSIRFFSVPTITATAPSNAAYATMSLSWTATGSGQPAYFVDDAYFQDNNYTKYTTSLAHNLLVNDFVTIIGVTPSGYNTTNTPITSVDSTTSFTLLNSGLNTNLWTAASFSGSTATTTNIYPQYATNSIMSSIGRSYYWPNIDVKYSRLLKTIGNYLPLGSTYTVSKGIPAYPKDESFSSIVPSYSCENNLYGWSGYDSNNTISRYVSSGSLTGVKGYSSTSWLVAKNVTGNIPVGAKIGFHVTPSTRYQFYAQIMSPSTSGASHSGYTNMLVDWYTDSTMSTSISTNNIIDNNNNITNENFYNRWGVLSGVQTSPNTAFYAVLKIKYEADASSNNDFIYIDNVICISL